MLTGSPPCHIHISWSKIAPEIRKKRMDEALHHLHVSVDLYGEQYRQGRFLHEAATSWEPEHGRTGQESTRERSNV